MLYKHEIAKIFKNQLFSGAKPLQIALKSPTIRKNFVHFPRLVRCTFARIVLFLHK